MAVSFVAATQVANTNLTDQTSVTAFKPGGTAQGDIMVAVFTAPYTGSLTYTAPSGWTLASSHNGGGSVSLWSGLYYKIAGGSEPSSYTWTCSAAGSLNVGTATFRADHNGWNLYFASTQGTTGTITQPSMTPAGGEAFLAAHAVSWHDSGSSAGTVTSTSGAEKWDIQATDGSPSTHDRGSACYVNSSVTSGGGTDSGATMTVSSGQDSYVAWTFGVSEMPNGAAASTMGGFTSSLAATEQVAVYRSTATAVSPAGTNVTSLTINKPAGTVDDDYMVALISTNNTTTTAPSGWTLLEGPTTDGSGLSTYLYQKKAASEGTDYTWTFANAGGKTGSISSFSNSTGVDSWLSKVTHTTDPAAGDSLTTVGPAIRYDVFAWREQADATVTWDTGTETHDIVTNNSGGVRVGQSGTYQQASVAAGGTIAAATADPTGTLTFSVMWSIAIGSKVTATGTMGSTMGGFTSSLGGSVGGGTLGSTMGGFTSSLSGAELTGGPIGSTMGAFSSAFAGQRLVTGSVGSTMGSFTSSLAGSLKGIAVELLIDGTWTNVTEHVRYDQGVSITRGRTAEGTSATTGMANLRLDNRADTTQNRYSLRNASGPYFGKIGRNTQIRITKLEYGYRFWGEVSSWTPGADNSGNDQYVDVEASGLIRRLDASKSSVLPAMQREVMANSPLAYWPCDEASGSFASPIPGVRNMQVAGSPTYGDYTALPCSNPIPQLNTSAWHTPTLFGTDVDGGVTVSFLLASPGGITNGTNLFRIYFQIQSGDAKYSPHLGLVYSGTNELSLAGVPTVIMGGIDTATGTVPIVGKSGVLVYVGIKNGTFGLWYQGETDASPVLIGEVTWAGVSTETPISLFFNEDGNDLSNNSAAYIGQVAVWDGYGPSNTLEYASVGAYAGEAAGTRFARLCTEEGITATVNNAANSSAMGPQLSNSVMNLLRECEATDMGIMYELRDDFGLGYVVRRDLYNQDVTLELDYSAGDLSSQLQPAFDDKDTKNDVTVQRTGGSSARYVVNSDSPLSTQDPPNGVGLYATSVNVSLNADSQCYPQAGWRAHLGTVDEERITSVGVTLESANFASLRTNALTVDSGSRLTVSNCPNWTQDVDQIVQGYREQFDPTIHTISYNTSSAKPYNTAVVGSVKADSLTSTLGSDIDSDDTSLSVAVTGVPWTVNASADFDIIVGGERMTVTAVSGTSSPQTFTVTRSVNGVSKSHDSGEQVRLYKPAIVGL
jgi:hypothetical protein